MKKKLVKSNKDIVITGSLAGIAEYFKIDPTIARVLFILSLFWSWGTSLIIYIIMAIIIPTPKLENQNFNGNFQNSKYNNKQRTRKEAEKVDDDEWSDY